MSHNKSSWLDIIAREPEVRVRLTRCPEAEAAAELNNRKFNLHNAKLRSSKSSSPQQSCPNPRGATLESISRKSEPSGETCFVCKCTSTERRTNSSRKYLDKIFLFKTLVLSRDYLDTLPPSLPSGEKNLDAFNCVCTECSSIVNQLWDLHNQVQTLQAEIDLIVERTRTTISCSSSTNDESPKTAMTPGPSFEVQILSPCDQDGMMSTSFGDIGKRNANSNAYGDEDSQTILEFEIESVEGVKMEFDSEFEVDENDSLGMEGNPEVSEDSDSELSNNDSHTDNSEFMPEQTDEESDESDNDGWGRKKKYRQESPIYSFAEMEGTKITPGTDRCDSNSARTLRSDSKYWRRAEDEHGSLSSSTAPTGGPGEKTKLYRLLKRRLNKGTRKEETATRNKNPHVCYLCKNRYANKDYLIQHLYNHESEEEDKVLSCPLCEKEFAIQQLLERHILFHQQDSTKPLACPRCEFRFALDDEEALDRHMIFRHKVIDRLACHKCKVNFEYRSHLYKHDCQYHPDKFSLVCSYESCEKRYSSQQFFETHVTTHTEGPYNCTACSMKCTTAALLSEHLLGHTGEREEPQLLKTKREFVCTICNKFFYNGKRFAIHMESVHKKKKQYECSICPIGYSHKRDLIRHMYTHETEEKELSCPICMKKFTLQLLLDRHVSLHGLDSTKPLSCPVCEIRFKADEQQVLDKHLKDVHKKDKRQVSCSVCSQSFKTVGQLKSHDYIHHPGRRNLICSHPNCDKRYASQQYLNAHVITHSDGPFNCTVCKMKFSTANALTDHLMGHTGEPRYKCKLCDRTYPRVVQLTSHQATIHGEEKPYKCQHCDKRFITNGQKKNHEKHYHSNVKDGSKFPCSESGCGKKFLTPRFLRRHVLHVHGSSKMVQCHICGKQLKSSLMLKNHINSHKGIKPFQCSTCGKMFVTKPSLNLHAVTHTGEKKHKCPICGKGFTQQQSIRRHMVGHTKEKPYLCTTCGQRFTQTQSLKRHTLLAHKTDDDAT